MAVWVFLLALATYAGGVGTGWPLLQHVSYTLGLVLVGSFATALLARRGLSVSLSLDALHATAGERIEETISVSKHGFFPALWLLLVDAETGRRSFLGLRGGERREWQRARSFEHRGVYVVGGDTLRVRDPFGLFSLYVCTLEEVEVTVYPAPISVELTRELSGAIHRRTLPWLEPADASVGDLRQYTPGDPPQRIHWRSTARAGTLIVADPEPRSRRSAWLVVDLGAGDDVADCAAGVGAHLCALLHSSGLRIGAVVAGEETAVISPRSGPGATSAVLDSLARVPASDDGALGRAARALTRVETPDSLIVISSSSTGSPEAARLRRMSRTTTFVAPPLQDPAP
jgi:uncharacterized protein (DUF58 family)